MPETPPISIVHVKPTTNGQSILTIYRPEDKSMTPSVQQQLPTDIAKYIMGLIERDQGLS